jgi:hypothetical protein
MTKFVCETVKLGPLCVQEAGGWEGNCLDESANCVCVTVEPVSAVCA